MDTLVLGLGNDLLSDDAVGIVTARRLAGEAGLRADVVESSLHGLALLDLLLGYRRLIIIDAIKTGSVPPGTISVLTPRELTTVMSPSPHYAGLPEMIDLARELNLDFPSDIRIFAVEIADDRTFGGPMSTEVRRAIDEIVGRVRRQTVQWYDADRRPATTGN